MADPTEADDQVDEPPKKNWRKELEDRATAAEKAQVEMAQELALFKSGLVDLSDDQRDDVLTLAKAKGDTSPEALKAIADRLSYTKAQATDAEVTEEVVDDRSAELAQLATLAKSPAPTSEPQSGVADLSQFHTVDALFDHLRDNIDESFGPQLPTG